MSWIDDYKGEGPWSFTKQKDKWGYLNNPRWKSVPEAPTNYSSNPNAEPQVWTPASNTPYNSNGSVIHYECGHWHVGGCPVPGEVATRGYFLGEDQGLGDGPVDYLSSWPNSDAAFEAFIVFATNHGVESFESFAHLTNVPANGGPIDITFGGYVNGTFGGASAVLDFSDMSGLGGVNPYESYQGRYPVHGLKWMDTQTAIFGLAPYHFTFSEDLVGFGAYVMDAGDFAGTVVFEAVFSDASQYSVTLPVQTLAEGNIGGNMAFIGFFDTSKPFNQIRITGGGAFEDPFGIDYVVAIKEGDIDFCIGAAVQYLWPIT